MVDRLPEFQGPKYRGPSITDGWALRPFQRGDFADFHQRFSLVPRRMRGKIPQKTPRYWSHINQGSQNSETPTPASPPNEIGHLCCARPTPPGGTPSISLIPPPLRGVPKNRGGGVRIDGGCLKAQGGPKSRGG